MNNTITFTLQPTNNKRLINLCGEHDHNLQQIENYFNVTINNRGHEFSIQGDKTTIQKAKKTITMLFTETKITEHLTPGEINLVMHAAETNKSNKQAKQDITIKTPKFTIKPYSASQTTYLNNMFNLDINFGIGPAGTGKTYLAVAYAVSALENEQITRVIITRPIVEAGEKLGFLPGDVAQKIDPYLRPIYDALYTMLGFTKVAKLIENNVIEIAPLAFMRGRTLNDAIIILDEAQNTTIEQMKMFLTRIGFGSKAIITGDITQSDLPKNQVSGLNHAVDVLNKIKDVGFCFFTAMDIVRHPLVQKIVQAYEKNPLPRDNK